MRKPKYPPGHALVLRREPGVKDWTLVPYPTVRDRFTMGVLARMVGGEPDFVFLEDGFYIVQDRDADARGLPFTMALSGGYYGRRTIRGPVAVLRLRRDRGPELQLAEPLGLRMSDVEQFLDWYGSPRKVTWSQVAGASSAGGAPALSRVG